MRLTESGLLLGGSQQSVEQRWQLVASLFQQPRSLAVAGLGTLLTAVVCWQRTGHLWYVIWAAASCVVLILRLGQAYLFNFRRELLGADGWARLFVAGAAAAAAIAGFGAGLTVLRSGDSVATLYMATNVISFAGAAAVRNNASPLAAISQTTIALGVPGLACLATGIPYLQVFAVLILFHLVAQFEIIRSLGRTTCWLMSSERQQALLNQRLATTCEQLGQANTRLAQLSSTDGLTGLSNRRALDAALSAEWQKARGTGASIALLMVDVDHFKSFNDRYGHLVGDDALRWIGQVLHAVLHRPSDLAARFGGEEFAILLPDTDIEGAVSAAGRIRSALATTDIASSLPASRLTVSIGAAASTPKSDQDQLMLVRAADQALYNAKASGRNRVVRSIDAQPAQV